MAMRKAKLLPGRPILTFAVGIWLTSRCSLAGDSAIPRIDQATLTVPQTPIFAFFGSQRRQAGEAERLCQRILASDRKHFAALHLLAIVRSVWARRPKRLTALRP
jgi:hypothetical protein